MLKDLEVNRMEDKEFISELLFFILEKDIISYTKSELDKLYEKWSNKELNIDENYSLFNEITNIIVEWNLDYDKYKISGVSHLYAIWILAYLCIESRVEAKKIKLTINTFYKSLRNKDKSKLFLEYSKSMNSATKSKTSRRKRVKALIDFIKESGININFNL